jgi:FtsH-binding integral membrane protein
MKLSNASIIIGVSLIALIYMIYSNVSKNLTTKSYIMTTYMYVFSAFLFIVLLNECKLLPEISHSLKIIALCFLSIILIISLNLISKDNQLFKHIIWIGFIACVAMLSKPVVDLAVKQNILNKVLISVGSMFLVMSYLAYTKPLDYFNSWYPYLYTSLIGLLASQLSNIIFSNLDEPSGFLSRDWYISAFAVLVFNGFLLYDTQKILKEGLVLDYICQGQDNLSCASYPDKSMNIILDLLNLFTNTTNIMKK